MRRASAARATALVLLSTSLACAAGTPGEQRAPASAAAPAEQRESIHDRVVHLEPELITEIPEVPRFCDQLGLTSDRVDVGGAELFVEEEGEGMPLVLINGGPGGTHHYFHPWFGRAASYARVIYYDQRGCGLSDFEPGRDGYSVEQAVDDLDALRAGLGIDRWVVLGYSYGGFVAQLYSVTYPEHVAGLVLLGALPATSADLGSSRQSDFFSEEELARKKEIREQLRELSRRTDMSTRTYTQLLIYNNFLNGDWKRQNYYRPSRERIAQMALYEWDHDDNFNSIVNQSTAGIDLAGAFDASPIPTLILEGKWDLTWGESKAQFLAGQHPNGRLIVFEEAGHGIYDEDTEGFFAVLEEFMRGLPDVSAAAIADYKATIPDWRAAREASADYALRDVGWGWNSSRELAGRYSRAWLDELGDASSILRVGFALYDVERYDDARVAFEHLAAFAAAAGEQGYQAVAMIWRGHMLDLLGRRDEAVATYRRVADMELRDSWSHSQYAMRYELSGYARERMASPFERIENRDPS